MPEGIDSTNHRSRSFGFLPEMRQGKEEDVGEKAPMRPVASEDCRWSDADTVTNTGLSPTEQRDRRGLLQLGGGHEPVASPSCIDKAELARRARAIYETAAPDAETVSYPGFEFLKIRGSPEYQERVKQYLDTIAGTASGQRALQQLAEVYSETGKKIIMREGFCGVCAEKPRRNVAIGLDGIDQLAQDYPHLGENAGPVALLHELVHAYQYSTGKFPVGSTMEGPKGMKSPIPNFEREAIGLPYNHDGDPATPMVFSDLSWSENTLREELGIPLREAYITM